jgi:hypothetical protein
MGYYFVTASKDASVYLQQPNQNTGLDEVLEVSKVYYGTIRDVSRALIQFDLTHLSQSLSSGLVSLEDAELILRETESEEIPLEYTVYGYPINTSWEMGPGKRFDEISTQGATWNYAEGDTATDWLTSILVPGIDANPNSGAGGVWITSVAASQSFDYQSADIKMDVKSILESWLSGSITNNGLILKHSNAFENNTSDYGILKFFSKETHTIYQPKIAIGWDDQTFTTGSLTPLSTDAELVVKPKPIKNDYRKGKKYKIKIAGREAYPVKTFSSSFSYGTSKYLPSTTQYQIRDFDSNDVIIPFGNYSKVSCDTNGNYIEIDFTNWESNRVYKIEFKIDVDGNELYYDDEITFNVID